MTCACCSITAFNHGVRRSPMPPIWWEVEGYLEPSEGTFFCADVASLRQRLLDMPIKQFDLVVELAYQARSMVAELEGGARLPTGPALLREMTVWLAGAVPESARAKRRTPSQGYTRVESKEQRRRREQERAVQACQQGYLVVFPDTPQAVTDAFRRWCKEHAHPYIWIETRGQQQATLRAQTKAVLRKWQECCKLDGILRTERNSIHGYLPTVQMASLPGRDYFAVCPLVPAVSAQLPRSGGDDDRARIAYRSHDDLPLGAALRTRTGEALQISSQGHERLVARR